MRYDFALWHLLVNKNNVSVNSCLDITWTILIYSNNHALDIFSFFFSYLLTDWPCSYLHLSVPVASQLTVMLTIMQVFSKYIAKIFYRKKDLEIVRPIKLAVHDLYPRTIDNMRNFP